MRKYHGGLGGHDKYTFTMMFVTVRKEIRGVHVIEHGYHTTHSSQAHRLEYWLQSLRQMSVESVESNTY